MKPRFPRLVSLAAVVLNICAFTSFAPAQERPVASPPPAVDAKAAEARVRSDAEQEKKATEWIGSLQLADPEREERLRMVVAAHLKAIRDWHNDHPYTTVP